MLDYGFNFMNTKIYIDNESRICIVKNPVFHSKTKHIEIRHHFIRDAYEKKLIQVLKIHTDDNVADLLTKAFDVVGTADTKIYAASVGFYHHTTNGHQFTMSNRHQELASPEQMASGQTKIGKESLNPLMANSLPKTIQSNDPPLSRGYTLGSGEDSLKLMELMAYSTASTNVNGEVQLIASIDGQAKTITEASLRRHLKLEDNDGITSLPNTEIFEQLALIGYATNSDKLTFQKVTRGCSGEDIPLFPSMITAPETSPLRITSSPSLSPQHTLVSTPSTSPPPITETIPTAEEPAPMPHESPI
ncbi:hypothetical protein Tco_0924332 [Tanacetum coccineum]|uniref:Uncharacterized protein n=1 Tax=Tanacetum coccineum TaxID=301880 RepID=A0ABQ5D6K9_9ASTR